jgi:competence protein ComEC
VDIQAPAGGSIRLTVRWPAVEPGALPSAVPQPIRCGEQLRTLVRLRQPETYHDPGVWNREEYLVGQGITSTATVDVARVEPVGRASPVPLACRLSALQQASTMRILALPAAMQRFPSPLRLTQEDAVMLAAMLAGDRTYLTRSMRAGFERTGSFHMLVVSGLHLAIVAGFISWITRRLYIPPVYATLLTLAASCVYALFTGFATPVQRSLWMVTLYLLARLVYRQRSPLNTIGFASLCLLAASPRSLFESSLQMTLLAVVAIAGIASPLLENTIRPYLTAARDLAINAIDPRLDPRHAQFKESLRLFAESFDHTRYKRLVRGLVPGAVRMILRAVELLVIACIVELAMTLPMALYFHRITILALPVNLFILPLLVLLMPAGLVTLLAALVWPPAAAFPAALLDLPLHFGSWLVHRFGSIHAGDFRVPAPPLGQSLGFCVLLAAAMLLARGSRWPRRAAWVVVVLAALLSVYPPAVQHPHGALLFEALDVGQGDSLLLITPDGMALLVDGGGLGGPLGAHTAFDIGEEVVSEALWSRGIRKLDAVALTHAHSDHMGGLPAVLRNFRPAELWIGNNPHGEAYDALLAQASDQAMRIRPLRAGDRLPFGSAQISVLAPMPGYTPGPQPTNNDSLVMRASLGATSVLLEGDAEAPLEDAMLAEPGLASSLLKVGHHGSLTSTRPEFLARVAPQWAVISCGLGNRYGHPRQEVLAALQSARVRTFSTDLNGAVCFQLDGRTLAADPTCAWQRRP